MTKLNTWESVLDVIAGNAEDAEAMNVVNEIYKGLRAGRECTGEAIVEGEKLNPVSVFFSDTLQNNLSDDPITKYTVLYNLVHGSIRDVEWLVKFSVATKYQNPFIENDLRRELDLSEIK